MKNKIVKKLLSTYDYTHSIEKSLFEIEDTLNEVLHENLGYKYVNHILYSVVHKDNIKLVDNLICIILEKYEGLN